MIRFSPDEYKQNYDFIKKDTRIHTFFICDGFDLDPFPDDSKPWSKTDFLNDDGFHIYHLDAVIDFILPNGEVCRVPKGFLWDGASIPKATQWLIGKPIGKYSLGALLHDWLYASRILGNTKEARLKADELFYQVMEQLDISWWKRKLMYRAVRLGGSYAYHKTNEVDHCKRVMHPDDLYNPWNRYKKYFPNAK